MSTLNTGSLVEEVFLPSHFWHIQFRISLCSKGKEKGFSWECLRALQCVSHHEVPSRRADFVPSATALYSSPAKRGSHTLFSWSLCHLRITASLQLARCLLCTMCLTQDLQDMFEAFCKWTLTLIVSSPSKISAFLTKLWEPDYPLFCLVLSPCKMSISVIWEYFKIKLCSLWTSTNEHTSGDESGMCN